MSESERALAALSPTLPEYEASIREHPTRTIRPPTPRATLVGSPGAAEGLAERVRAIPVRTDLAYGEVLGRGGMGLVRAATQASLGRVVAVKTLREDAPRELGVDGLLREAWVTGALEHPNVVPVHDLAVDAEGRPLLVLKRIDGTAWSALIADPDRLQRDFGVQSPRTWHLRVLMQVCTAVAFAHSRGILHRDLKPENVMVGQYGEVYVLDWGLAVALEGAADERLPRASEVRAIAGTPAYMAPEMLARPSDRLSVATDVYLLGASLYHVLAGRPPHLAPSALGVMMRVLDARPDPLPDVPEALAAICARAMAARPEDRFPTALALRDAIGAWLEHRASITLANEARRRLASLAELSPDLHDDTARMARYRLLGECRFGFKQALAIWSDNEAAREGLRAAIEAMIEFELAQGDHRAAAVLLDELEDPAEALRARIAALRLAGEQAALEAARHREVAAQYDVQAGARSRRHFAVVLGLFWCAFPFYMALQPADALTWGQVLGGPAVFLAVALALTLRSRRALMRTAVNRNMLATALTALTTLVTLDAAAWLGGQTPREALRQHPLIDAGFIITLVIAVDKRLWPAAVVALAAAAAAAYNGAWAEWCIFATTLSLSASAWRVWTGDDKRGHPARDDSARPNL